MSIFAVLVTFSLPNYKNMILNRKIDAAVAEIVDLINLAKNTTLTRKTYTAICASDGANNCINTDDFTKNGANLVLAHYQHGISIVEKVEIGRELVLDDQNNSKQVAQPRLDASNVVLNKIFNIRICADKHKGVISKLYTGGEKCNKKTRPPHAPTCHSVMKKYELMYGYALGYIDFDDSIQGDFLDKFISNGKGVYSNVHVEHTGRHTHPYDWTKSIQHRQPQTYLNEWKAVDGSINLSYKVTSVDLRIPNSSRTGTSECMLKDNVAAVINNVKKVAPVAPNHPPKYKEKIIYGERIKNIPSKLVFNPQQNEKGKFVKDENGNYAPSNEVNGVIHRLNPFENNVINVSSRDKTLVFNTNNVLNKINDANNEIIPLQGYAVIIVSDNKRGVGKHSKQICISVLGITKVISGDQTCEI